MKSPIIGIIGGKGKLGKLFAEFFREKGIKTLISDKKTKLINTELAGNSDIIIISVPIDVTEKVIKEVLPFTRKESAIMDFTSVKVMPIKAMMKGNCEVLGLHPMFGNSNPIPGQTILFCPTKKSGFWSKWIEDFFTKNKVKIAKLSSEEHDKLMSIEQCLVHFADITFIEALRRSKFEIKDLYKYTSKSTELKIELAARLIAQDAGLYGNIQIQNPHTITALKKYFDSMRELLETVKKKDLSAFKKYFLRARKSLKGYEKEAYKDSSHLIDILLEKQRAEKNKKTHKYPQKTDIAVLGPRQTFSDIGAQKYLERQGLKINKYYAKEIDEIFDLVENGKVSLGIAPIENNAQGTIRETLDGLFYKNVHITDEISIPIHHCLITLSNAKREDIKQILSHPQALGQCKKYLSKFFPKAELVPYSSTTAAIEKLINSNEKSIAVIAPEIAGEKGELKIFKKNIEDNSDNATTFVVIEKGIASDKTAIMKNRKSKTSIAFHFNADSPGSLFTVFKDFSDAKINMTKIESRPTKISFGQYIFYLDFDGNISDKSVSETLKKVSQKVAKLKVLGSY